MNWQKMTEVMTEDMTDKSDRRKQKKCQIRMTEDIKEVMTEEIADKNDRRNDR